MDSIYWIIITALLLLAAFDLINGVANDAVNFLNSALGSKVAPRRVILWVAAAGILVGTLTSSGMMEVARSGMFNPGLFTFHEIMMLYLGVMFANIILLDVYNTMGLPTSTTVALIFCFAAHNKVAGVLDEEIAHLDVEKATRRMQEIYSAPIRGELISQRLNEIRAAGVPVAGSLSPENCKAFASVVESAGVDFFVIRGTTVSAEHVGGENALKLMNSGTYDQISGAAFTQAMRAPQRDQRLLNQYFQRIEQLAADLSDQQVMFEMNKLLGDGVHGIEQISEIVLNLKNFSRLDRERITNFSVEAGLESTLLLARNLLKNRIEIRRDYGQVPEISGSPSQVNQVFLNLITNAAHAMPERDTPNVITLRTSVAPEEHMVLIEIQDNGSGIPEAIQDRIFDPFFTTKTVGKGTGQGLTIVHDIIVNKHGGQIQCASAPGQGTTFTLRIPLFAL